MICPVQQDRSWTPLDKQKVSMLSRCSDKAPFGTISKCVYYAGVLIFKCPDKHVSL